MLERPRRNATQLPEKLETDRAAARRVDAIVNAHRAEDMSRHRIGVFSNSGMSLNSVGLGE